MKKFLGLFLIFSSAALFADGLKISVKDKDLDFPLEGVRVYLVSKTPVSAQTDENGEAVLELPDSVKSGTIRAALPGYSDSSVKFSGTEKALSIEMSIAGVIEGKELVVNRAVPESKEEKTGVSKVLSKEQMHTTSNIGLVEDCMASVKTLPGVSASWGSEPSIRGGEPRETATIIDGMYTVYPYQWGAFSILFPSVIDSVKLSNGVFSAKYGKASAGIIEANTLKPDFENLHVDLSLGTTTADAFVQVPFGKNVGGMIVGTHLTFLDPIFWAYKKSGNDDAAQFSRAPYIRDFFLKTNFTPSSELDVSLIGFFCSDGASIEQTDTDDGVKSEAKFDYDTYQALGGVNVKWLASEKVLLHGLVSYNGIYDNAEAQLTDTGYVRYNDKFMQKYGDPSSPDYIPELSGKTGYFIPNLTSKQKEKIKNHLFTGRFESEIELNEKNHLCAGIDEYFSMAKTREFTDAWVDINEVNPPIFKNIKQDQNLNGNCILNNAAFVTWTFGADKDLIQSEIGVRGEFMQLWNREENFSVNFIPDVCPRATFTLTPWHDIGKLDKASFTFGAGLFASVPRDIMIFDKSMGLEDFESHTNRAIFGVLGADAVLTDGWKFKVESYYRHYLNRIYTYKVTDALNPYDSTLDSKIGTDGKGHVFGVDAMIENKINEKWDGYISYSFVNSRMKNPAGIKSGESTSSNEPLDEWYYPSFHRFHTMNLVSNWHFGSGYTFTLKGTLASGAPKDRLGDVTCFAAKTEDGTVVQRYTQSSVYSDTLRTSISFPIDVRLSKQWKSNNGKTSYEWYVGIQDLLSMFYRPKGDKSFNSYTGKMSDNDAKSDYSLGFPLPSVGFKVKF